jgi:hypothetical protein
VLRSAFAGFRFPSDVIVLAIRWYLRFGWHCCICAEGVTDEYLRGDCFHSEGYENGSKRPIVNAL